jgi:hypothetical protein
MNKGNRPTSVTSNRQDIIDITIATFYAGHFIKDWDVSGEVSCSDHRYIRFNITGIDHLVESYCNPQRTDRESFRTDTVGDLCHTGDRITNIIDLETAARQFQNAVISAHNDNCPSVVQQEYILVEPTPCGEKEESLQIVQCCKGVRV